VIIFFFFFTNHPEKDNEREGEKASSGKSESPVFTHTRTQPGSLVAHDASSNAAAGSLQVVVLGVGCWSAYSHIAKLIMLSVNQLFSLKTFLWLTVVVVVLPSLGNL